jgi:hypothetical protein
VLFVATLVAAWFANQQSKLAEQRLADLCKAVGDSAALADRVHDGSVYDFRREYHEIADLCGE